MAQAEANRPTAKYQRSITNRRGVHKTPLFQIFGMLTLAMKQPSYIPARVTFAVGLLVTELFVFLSVFGQAPTDPIAAAQSWFSWIVAAAGFVTLAIGIGYGFFKKQRYENLKTERDELKSLAESREDKINDLKTDLSDQKTKFELKISQLTLQLRGSEDLVTNLVTGNKSIVSENLQMKAILKGLRVSGVWHGNEDDIHRTAP